MKTVCSRCAHENRVDRRFCSACGRALGHRCAACGFSNEAGDRFCGGCGARLAPPLRTAGVLPPLEVLDLGAACGTLYCDDLPPVSDDADERPLDSGEFRALFDL